MFHFVALLVLGCFTICFCLTAKRSLVGGHNPSGPKDISPSNSNPRPSTGTVENSPWNRQPVHYWFDRWFLGEICWWLQPTTTHNCSWIVLDIGLFLYWPYWKYLEIIHGNCWAHLKLCSSMITVPGMSALQETLHHCEPWGWRRLGQPPSLSRRFYRKPSNQVVWWTHRWWKQQVMFPTSRPFKLFPSIVSIKELVGIEKKQTALIRNQVSTITPPRMASDYQSHWNQIKVLD